MRIFVRVYPRSRNPGVEESGSPQRLLVRVKEKPIDGSANEAVIQELARYFNVPQSSISLVSGRKYKEKIFEIS